MMSGILHGTSKYSVPDGVRLVLFQHLLFRTHIKVDLVSCNMATLSSVLFLDIILLFIILYPQVNTFHRSRKVMSGQFKNN